MFIALVYLVPSWKMLPTSMPLLMRSAGLPHTGQIPPSTALAAELGQIVARAEEAGVAVEENPLLAKALSAVELDRQIRSGKRQQIACF